MSFKDCWQGRIDSEDGEYSVRWHQVIRFIDHEVKKAELGLIGYPCDLGVMANKGRVGAAKGPDSIRRMLANLPFNSSNPRKKTNVDTDFLDQEFAELDVVTRGIIDFGNVEIADSVEQSQQNFSDGIYRALNIGIPVIGLGGGHDIAFASYDGYRRFLGAEKRIGIINFDAHLDLRNTSNGATSGTPFRQIAEQCQANQQVFHYACLGVSSASNTNALFNYAKTTHTRMLSDLDFCYVTAQQTLTPMLEHIDALYVTICLDAFLAANAPGVSAPSAVGISIVDTLKTLNWLGQECKQRKIAWLLTDIAELNPDYDIDNRTARLAARLVHQAHASMTQHL